MTSKALFFVPKGGWGGSFFTPCGRAECFWFSTMVRFRRHSLLVLNLAATGLTCHRRILERRSFSCRVRKRRREDTTNMYNLLSVFSVHLSSMQCEVVPCVRWVASNPKWVEVSPAFRPMCAMTPTSCHCTLRIQRTQKTHAFCNPGASWNQASTIIN